MQILRATHQSSAAPEKGCTNGFLEGRELCKFHSASHEAPPSVRRPQTGCSGWVETEEGEERASELARRWGAETQKAGGNPESRPQG